MSADVVLWLIVCGVGLIWLGFWWMNHGPERTEDNDRRKQMRILLLLLGLVIAVGYGQGCSAVLGTPWGYVANAAGSFAFGWFFLAPLIWDR